MRSKPAPGRPAPTPTVTPLCHPSRRSPRRSTGRTASSSQPHPGLSRPRGHGRGRRRRRNDGATPRGGPWSRSATSLMLRAWWRTRRRNRAVGESAESRGLCLTHPCRSVAAEARSRSAGFRGWARSTAPTGIFQICYLWDLRRDPAVVCLASSAAGSFLGGLKRTARAPCVLGIRHGGARETPDWLLRRRLVSGFRFSVRQVAVLTTAHARQRRHLLGRNPPLKPVYEQSTILH